MNENNDVVAKNIRINDETTTADIYIKGDFYETLTFPFVGDHLLLNALAVISVCYLENVDKEEVKNQVSKIEHAKRRFIEEKFKSNILIDDYAHHPTEVKVTIEAAKKKYPSKKNYLFLIYVSFCLDLLYKSINKSIFSMFPS
jgi:UDP-N-acetylmuramate--alanine ligase